MDRLSIENRLIVPMDVADFRQAEQLFEQVGRKARFFKVGYELFYGSGAKAVELAKSKGARVFLDLKLHDIPNTVAKAVEQLMNLGVDMLTLHISGGGPMLNAAREAAEKRSAQLGIARPLLLGVTVLTSIGEEDLRQDGIQLGLEELVIRRALFAQAHGIDGVICSPLEAASIKKMSGGGLVTVTPGIRLSDAHGDQKRVTTPADAMRNGSDFIVVGRPIYAAANPSLAFDEVIQNMKEGLV